MRSKWKGFFISKSLLNSKLSNKSVIWSRSSVVFDSLVGQRVNIYNGKSKTSILIKRPMLSFKFGSFIVTKRLGSQIHQKFRKGSKR